MTGFIWFWLSWKFCWASLSSGERLPSNLSSGESLPIFCLLIFHPMEDLATNTVLVCTIYRKVKLILTSHYFLLLGWRIRCAVCAHLQIKSKGVYQSSKYCLSSDERLTFGKLSSDDRLLGSLSPDESLRKSFIRWKMPWTDISYLIMGGRHQIFMNQVKEIKISLICQC